MFCSSQRNIPSRASFNANSEMTRSNLWLDLSNCWTLGYETMYFANSFVLFIISMNLMIGLSSTSLNVFVMCSVREWMLHKFKFYLRNYFTNYNLHALVLTIHWLKYLCNWQEDSSARFLLDISQQPGRISVWFNENFYSKIIKFIPHGPMLQVIWIIRMPESYVISMEQKKHLKSLLIHNLYKILK